VTRSPNLLLAAALLAAACVSPPAPLTLPPARIAVAYAPAPAGAAGSPQRLHIEVLAVRDAVAGASIETTALRLPSEHGMPFRAASPLPPGSRWLAGDAAAAWRSASDRLGPECAQRLATDTALLAPQWQTRVAFAEVALPRLCLQWPTAGPTPHVELWLQVEDAHGQRREVHFADPFAEGPAVLFVATRGAPVAGHAIVLTPAGIAGADAIGIAEAAMQREAAAAAADTLPAPWRAALRAVGQHQRRPALLALARTRAATRALDLLLVADEASLIAVTHALATSDAVTTAAAWPFERAVWHGLLGLADRGDLGPAMQAAFTRHLGALALHSGTLRALLDEANDSAAFAALLREENVHALGDRDPAARCAGHDWLVQNGEGVPGFDPLASPTERRAALRAHAEAGNTTSEGGR